MQLHYWRIQKYFVDRAGSAFGCYDLQLFTINLTNNKTSTNPNIAKSVYAEKRENSTHHF